ncbi:DNA-binding protein [Ameyamaea chiangmaiensis NBRC 103196]|uniref:Prolyl-tRNA synthetase associated domain-containing protein n=1 Tax=Ameyamaea chiangmaiensis TaxID=442969 RepID=A0A850PEA4_9PROT|nr:prolyl-tRNA synthetase associated domain-containing protein [Ameyamaea chiangmaiensis]MBS4076073.1 prolyl-tRNA synthetase associated domain-containing protein [Ameyamaea chiangmaiensis]NVN41019.1 prolyl-tRNA synthetase associated domain-containing protein [Ameyamaea chiangmaiensis]GBQ66910.1 DNA-binding protein [Ameyamaea chiangmaiensis NBRC 103196]
MNDALRALLDRLAFQPKGVRHPPVGTVEEAHRHYGGLEGTHTKNAFLKDAKGVLVLVTVPADCRLDMKALPALIGTKRLSFASPDLMRSVLGTEPGALGPLSLVADRQHQVRFAIESSLLEADAITCHPLDNTETWVIPRREFGRIMDDLGIAPIVFTLESVAGTT